MPYEQEKPPPKAVQELVQMAEVQGRQLVMGCDANSHLVQWSSTDNKDRRKSILDLLATNNQTICNGSVYTDLCKQN